MIQLTFGFPPTIVVLHYVSRVESERESLLWGRGRLTGLGPDCFTNTFGVFVCHQYVWWTCVNPMPSFFEDRPVPTKEGKHGHNQALGRDAYFVAHRRIARESLKALQSQRP